LSQQNKALYNR